MKPLNNIGRVRINKTLQIKVPCGHTLITSFLFIIIIVIMVEAAFRLDVIESRLDNSNLGGRHEQFARQLSRMEKLVITEGPIDCIFVGSSLVWLDINPIVFEDAFWKETGETIRCFNFGIEAMPTTATAGLVPILMNKFKPRLLIYGIHARDLGTPGFDENARVILDSPWYRYQKGDFSVIGWLATHSYLFRNKNYLAKLSRFNTGELHYQEESESYYRYGFDPKKTSKFDVNFPPDPETVDPGLRIGFEFYSNYEIRNENLDAMSDISELQTKEMQIVYVIMPVHENFYQFFANGYHDYAQFTNQIVDSISSTGIPFLSTQELSMSNKEYWWDYSHMTLEGANVFSKWLGAKIGGLVNGGRLASPLRQ